MRTKVPRNIRKNTSKYGEIGKGKQSWARISGKTIRK